MGEKSQTNPSLGRVRHRTVSPVTASVAVQLPSGGRRDWLHTRCVHGQTAQPTRGRAFSLFEQQLHLGLFGLDGMNSTLIGHHLPAHPGPAGILQSLHCAPTAQRRSLPTSTQPLLLGPAFYLDSHPGALDLSDLPQWLPDQSPCPCSLLPPALHHHQAGLAKCHQGTA